LETLFALCLNVSNVYILHGTLQHMFCGATLKCLFCKIGVGQVPRPFYEDNQVSWGIWLLQYNYNIDQVSILNVVACHTII